MPQNNNRRRQQNNRPPAQSNQMTVNTAPTAPAQPARPGSRYAERYPARNPVPSSGGQINTPPKPPSPPKKRSTQDIQKEFFTLQKEQLRLQRRALNTQSRELALYNQQIQEQNAYYGQQLQFTQQQVSASEQRASQYMAQLDFLTQTEQKQQREAELQQQFAEQVFNIERQQLGVTQNLARRDLSARRGILNNAPQVNRSLGMMR